MIYAKLSDKDTYKGLSRDIAKAVDFLNVTDLASLTNGRHEIDGEHVFALVFEYETKNRQKAKWEAHEKYVDIHIVLNGEEMIGYERVEALTVITPYVEKDDILFLSGEGNFFPLGSDHFVLFYPGEAHMPGICLATSNTVRKMVIKVRV